MERKQQQLDDMAAKEIEYYEKVAEKDRLLASKSIQKSPKIDEYKIKVKQKQEKVRQQRIAEDRELQRRLEYKQQKTKESLERINQRNLELQM